jgi:hypothetical protein
MSILVRAQVERCKVMEPGKTLNADPGGTDLQKAIDLANISRPEPISEEEANAYGVDILFMSSSGSDFIIQTTSIATKC